MTELNDFIFLEGLGKSSASKTDIWKLKSKKDGKIYIMKLFINTVDGKTHPRYYKLLKHELIIYDMLRKKLINEKNSKNILFYETIGVTNFEKLFSFVDKSKYNTLNKKELLHNFVVNNRFMLGLEKSRVRINSKPDTHIFFSNVFYEYNIKTFTYSYIITPLMEKDFSDFLYDYKIKWTLKKLCKYMSIILSTVYQISSTGINQNDLHFGNIFLSNTIHGPTKWHSKNYVLIINNKVFMVDLEYTIYIYDFDRSAVKNKYIKELSSKRMGGNCPEFHTKRDFLKIICGLYQHLKYINTTDMNLEKFRKFLIQKFIKSSKLRDAIDYDPGCFLSEDGNSLQCNGKLLDSGMVSVQELLKFFFETSDFKTVSMKKIISRNKTSLNKIVEHLKQNKWKGDILKYITNNIQFIGNISITDKNLFIMNVFSKYKESTN